MNDFLAIFIFSITGMASSFLAKGNLDGLDIKVFILNILFFVGSTFYVKTMIREKNNKVYKWISFSYHILLPAVLLVSQEWIVAAALLQVFLEHCISMGNRTALKKLGCWKLPMRRCFLYSCW